MTSKNSFLASIKENSKRRIWLYVVSTLLWVFINPVLLAFVLSAEREQWNDLPADTLQKVMMRATLEWSSINTGFAVFVVGIAIVCAIQGFSYLNNKRKVDLYYSVPVSQPKRFAVIYINSFMIFFIPYLGSVLLKLLVAFPYGTLSTEVLWASLMELLIYVVLFLSVYSFVLIPVMLTGNLVITLLGTGVFFFFELLSKEIAAWYQGEFFSYYSYGSVTTLPVFHPVGQFGKLLISMGGKNRQLTGTQIMILGIMLLLWLVFTVIAYVCFRKRPAESAGKPMVFEKSKPVVKIILSVITTMFVGALYQDMASMGSVSSFLFLLLFTGIGLLLSSCTMEVIYEMDIKAALRKKRHILIAGGFSLLLYLSFAFDWYGFDAWAPSPDKLESATVRVFQLEGDHEYYGYSYQGNELKKMLPITDVETICALSEAKYDWGNEEQELLPGSDLNIVYQMKNGKEVQRRFAVTKEGEAALNKLFLNEQFQKNNYMIIDDNKFETLKKNMTVTFNRGSAVERLSIEDLDVIRTLLIQDMKQMDYTTIKEEKIHGIMTFITKNEYDEYKEYHYDVYESYSGTMEYLERQGIYLEYYINPEDIDSIAVTNYNRKSFEGKLAGYDSEDMEVSKTYTEPSQITELTKALYPYSFAIVFKNNYVETDYMVTVTLKSDAISTATASGNNSFYILTDQVPDFVETDTVKSVTE